METTHKPEINLKEIINQLGSETYENYKELNLQMLDRITRICENG